MKISGSRGKNFALSTNLEFQWLEIIKSHFIKIECKWTVVKMSSLKNKFQNLLLKLFKPMKVHETVNAGKILI